MVLIQSINHLTQRVWIFCVPWWRSDRIQVHQRCLTSDEGQRTRKRKRLRSPWAPVDQGQEDDNGDPRALRSRIMVEFERLVKESAPQEAWDCHRMNWNPLNKPDDFVSGTTVQLLAKRNVRILKSSGDNLLHTIWSFLSTGDRLIVEMN